MQAILKVFTPRRVLASIAIGTVLALGAGCASTGSKETTGQYFHDARITSTIKAKLLEDQALQGFQIKVDTYRGHVILSGFVNRPEQVRQAVRIAHRVRGVTSVRNDLVVKSTESSGADRSKSAS
ncbi:MAG: BON domain-containing protein [Acidiferrobacter sp.]